MNPKAKTNLLVEPLPEETLVYDLDRHRAHCLDPMAALLLAEADGEKDIVALVEVLRTEFGESASEEAIRVGLDRLRRSRLLEWDGPELGSNGMSRREAIEKLTKAGIGLPSVMTVAMAQSQPGTKLTPANCMKDAMNLGRCCTNGRSCVQVGADRKCTGPPC